MRAGQPRMAGPCGERSQNESLGVCANMLYWRRLDVQRHAGSMKSTTGGTTYILIEELLVPAHEAGYLFVRFQGIRDFSHYFCLAFHENLVLRRDLRRSIQRKAI